MRFFVYFAVALLVWIGLAKLIAWLSPLDFWQSLLVWIMIEEASDQAAKVCRERELRNMAQRFGNSSLPNT